MAAILSEPRSEALGIQTDGAIFWNSPAAILYEQAIKREEAILADEGPIVARTTPHTGRSPNDKFIVREPSSENQIWWGKVNQPFSVEHFEGLRARVWEYMRTRDLFGKMSGPARTRAIDCRCVSSASTRGIASS